EQVSSSELRHATLAICIGVGALCAFFRAFAYLARTRPPISWRGRLVKGRWIIPGYDRVWVAPLMVAAISAVLAQWLDRSGLPIPVWAGVFTTVVLTLTLVLP